MAANPYELQRKRVSQETAATGAQENEALKRRFARMGGGLQGGAYIKAQERLSGMQEQNKQKALESVDIQESLAQEQKDEAERGRQFARGERLGSQEFASGESAIGRRFASEEAEKGRGWQSGEAEKQRGWQTGERIGAQDFAKGEREGAQAFSSWREDIGRGFQRSEREAAQQFARGEREGAQAYGSWREDINRGWQQGNIDRQFNEDVRVTDFNMKMAELMSKKTGMDYLMSGDITEWFKSANPQTSGRGNPQMNPLKSFRLR